jgi:hypothetical protein
MALPTVLGRGKLYVNGSAVGNCGKVSFAPKIEWARRNDYSTGVKRTGEIRVSGKTVTGSFTTDYITGTNLSMFLNGLLLASVVFVGNNPTTGPDILYSFTDVAIMASGEADLVGDDWQKLSFMFEGTTTDPVASAAGQTWSGGTFSQQQSQWSTTTTLTTTSTTGG